MGEILSKLKSINFRSKCFSSCCNDEDIDVDIDLNGDKKPDINIHLKDGHIEVKSPPN
jgi:hypothetical protein